jgi:polyisoprenoid-binding protein YceI
MFRLVLPVAAAAAVAVTVTAQTPPPLPQTPPAQPGPAAQQAAPLGPNTWSVDGAHTAAHFSVKHMLVSTVRGTLGKVSGTVDYDGKSADSVKADISIDLNGIDTGVEGRDKDLRSANFFDVATFPTLTFKSKRVEAAGSGKFKLIGDLTIHGVTKEVALDVEGPSPILKQANGAQRVGASATTTLNRRDFGLQYNRMVESAPVVGDDIAVQIDIEANKRPAAAPTASRQSLQP